MSSMKLEYTQQNERKITKLQCKILYRVIAGAQAQVPMSNGKKLDVLILIDE